MAKVVVQNTRKIAAVGSLSKFVKDNVPDANVAWLDAWSIPIDDQIAAYLGTLDPTPLKFNPFLVEEHVQAASRRLDVCLSRRKDVLDLLDRAFRFEADHAFDTIANIAAANQVDSNPTIGQMQATSQAANAAVTAFGTSDRVAAGLAATARGVALASGDVNQNRVKSSLDAERTRVAAEKTRIETLYDFSQAPGHALNYKQRADRVFVLLKDDLAEAFQRLAALDAGLKLIWDEKSKLPERATYAKLEANDTSNILDDLVLYARWAVQRIEWHLSRESLVTYVFPMVQSFRRDAAATQAADALAPNFKDTVADENQDTECSFNLTAADFPGIERPRVIAIGAAYTPVDPNPAVATALCRVRVQAPKLTSVDAYDEQSERVLILGTVDRLNAGSLPMMSQAEVIRNIDPCKPVPAGEKAWKVKLLRGIANSSTGEVLRATVSDIKLFVAVAGRVGG